MQVISWRYTHSISQLPFWMEKVGEEGEYLENEKSFLGGIENIFRILKGFLLKYEN